MYACTDHLEVTICLDGMPEGAYTLKMYSSSVGDDANSNEYTSGFEWRDTMEIGGITFTPTFVICSSLLKHVRPDFMHIWLYFDSSVHRTTLMTTSLIARGFTAYDDSSPFELTLEGVRIATATIKYYDKAKPPRTQRLLRPLASVAALRSRVEHDYDAFAHDVASQYEKLAREFGTGIPINSPFYYVDSNIGKVPITTFAYTSSNVTNNERDVLKLLLSLDECTSQTHITTEQRLVDFCTMITRPLIYADDRTITPSGAFNGGLDLWVQLGTMPEFNRTSFDCEDGAGLVMSVVTMLRHAVIPHGREYERIRHLQYAALRYTPFLTLGNLTAQTLQGSRAYIPHAYVTMLDTQWVHAQINGTSRSIGEYYMPALVLESTASYSGVWTPSAVGDPASQQTTEPSQHAKHYIDIRTELRSAFERVDKKPLFSLCRLHTPIEASNAIVWAATESTSAHRGIYQDMYVMMTSDYIKQDGSLAVLHIVATETTKVDDGVGSSRRIGALAENLLMYSERVKLHVILNELRKNFNDAYSYVWKNQPKNYLPFVSNKEDTTRCIISDVPHVGYMDIPSRVWECYQVQINETCATLGTYKLHTDRDSIHIANGLSFERVYFVMK